MDDIEWRGFMDRCGTCKGFGSRAELHAEVKRRAGGPGLYVEIGVGDGSSIRWWDDWEAFGFDVFTGLPEGWGRHPAGSFACDPRTINTTATLVVGDVTKHGPRTILHMVGTMLGTARVLHIDCDLYEPALSGLYGFGLKGSKDWLIMDDLLCPAGVEHEQKALREWMGGHPMLSLEPIGRAVGQAVAFEVR